MEVRALFSLLAATSAHYAHDLSEVQVAVLESSTADEARISVLV